MTSDGEQGTTFDGLAEIDLQTDVLFDVLSNTRRQFVVACLDEYGSPMALADVADELATWEEGAPITDVSAEAVKSVYVALYHIHVPKLAEAGLVEYDQEGDTVAATDSGRQLASRVPLPEVSKRKATRESTVG